MQYRLAAHFCDRQGEVTGLISHLTVLLLQKEPILPLAIRGMVGHRVGFGWNGEKLNLPQPGTECGFFACLTYSLDNIE